MSKYKVQLRWGNHWRVQQRRAKRRSSKKGEHLWYYVEIFPDYAICTCSPSKQALPSVCSHIKAVLAVMRRIARHPNWKPERDHKLPLERHAP